MRVEQNTDDTNENENDEVIFVKEEQFQQYQFSTIVDSVALDDFIGRKKHNPSLLAFHKYHKSIVQYFRNCFGLHDDKVITGYEISEHTKNTLLNYILRKTCGDKSSIMNVHALQEDDLRKDIFDIGQSPDNTKKFNYHWDPF